MLFFICQRFQTFLLPGLYDNLFLRRGRQRFLELRGVLDPRGCRHGVGIFPEFLIKTGFELPLRRLVGDRGIRLAVLGPSG